MPNDGPMILPRLRVAAVDSTDPAREPEVRTRATRDHALIRQWAAERDAEPATGEHTSSGASMTFHVNDGDAGIRFNFPGHAPYRPISWNEWCQSFDEHDLTFLFERDEPGQPPSCRWRLVPSSQLRASASIV